MDVAAILVLPRGKGGSLPKPISASVFQFNSRGLVVLEKCNLCLGKASSSEQWVV